VNTAASDRRKLWLTRLFYAADLFTGFVKGRRCPSCLGTEASRLRPPGRRVSYFFSCERCGLFFRPTGLLNGAISEFYYSHLYDAGIATNQRAAEDAELRDQLIAEEGKNRNELVRALFGPPEAGEIGVFGCSWGYEVNALKQAGYAAFGIELSNGRRAWGRSRLGLPIYESSAAAAADGRAPVLVLSSHVLEHIPRLEPVLDELQSRLRPLRHIHITPYVEDFRTNGERSLSIGREHPLGVTNDFWQRWCRKKGFAVRTEQGGSLPATVSFELISVIETRSAGLAS